jgi:hypothetical protein
MAIIVGFVGYSGSWGVPNYADPQQVATLASAFCDRFIATEELEPWRILGNADNQTSRLNMKKQQEPDHFVVGTYIGFMFVRGGQVAIVGVPCGHKHRREAKAEACLAAKKKRSPYLKLYGRVFPVDSTGRGLLNVLPKQTEPVFSKSRSKESIQPKSKASRGTPKQKATKTRAKSS